MPDGEFLANQFFEDPGAQTVNRNLPEKVRFYLLFGINDETVPLETATRWQAAHDAHQRWPLPYDHTRILRAEETSQLLSEILDREFP